MLSDVDQALIDFINSIRRLSELRVIRARIPRKRHKPVRFVVDGLRIERAALKMAMSMTFVLRDVLEDWTLPPYLPYVIFGQKTLPKGVGLAFLGKVGDRITDSMEAFSVSYGKDLNESEPSGIAIELRHNLNFVCTWNKPIDKFSGFQVDDKIYLVNEHVIFHPERINYKEKTKDLELSFDFDWTGRWSENRYPDVARLRTLYKSPPR